jgi:hypothetical protein
MISNQQAMNHHDKENTFEKLLDNVDFVGYVLHGKNRSYWEERINNDEELKYHALHTRKVIDLLAESNEQISEDDIRMLWQSIDAYHNLNERLDFRKKVMPLMKYAAMLLLVCAMGASLWFYLIRNEAFRGHLFSDVSREFTEMDDAILQVYDGQTIVLAKDQSLVEVNHNGEIVVNQEQVYTSGVNGIRKKNSLNVLAVPFGKKTQVELADGTKVWLNGGSRIAFPSAFVGKVREVYLEGEAYFEVAHIQVQPFIVRANEVQVKVLGTCFTVTAYSGDEKIETVLLDGKVSLSKNSDRFFSRDEIILDVNQKASFGLQNRTFKVVEVEDPEIHTAWISGWFYFSQESLYKVLRKLEQYYNVHFSYEFDFTSADVVSGKLDLKESLPSVLMALGDVTNLEFEINNDTITIKKRPKI